MFIRGAQKKFCPPLGPKKKSFFPFAKILPPFDHPKFWPLPQTDGPLPVKNDISLNKNVKKLNGLKKRKNEILTLLHKSAHISLYNGPM